MDNKLIPVTTTHEIPNREIVEIIGVVGGEAVLGANVFRDVLASIRDFVGGRSGGYQKVLRNGRAMAMQDMVDEAAEMGADAIIGVDLDYESLGNNGSMMMVSCNGTAVRLR